MCILVPDIENVASTNIFARVDNQTQFLAYQMEISTSKEVAMVLPIPVDDVRRSHAVRFIDLSDYEEFFKDLALSFRRLHNLTLGRKANLEVIAVGSYDASYVPSINDFSRLDERFRLPEIVMEHVPDYSDYGFAVFQFKRGHQKPHPMAFSFVSAKPEQVFFPTTHLHDSIFHEQANFDHFLYLQNSRSPGEGWTAQKNARERLGEVEVSRTRELVSPELPIFRQRITGLHTNQDTWA